MQFQVIHGNPGSVDNPIQRSDNCVVANDALGTAAKQSSHASKEILTFDWEEIQNCMTGLWVSPSYHQTVRERWTWGDGVMQKWAFPPGGS